MSRRPPSGRCSSTLSSPSSSYFPTKIKHCLSQWMPCLYFTLATVSLVSDIERKYLVSQHLDDNLHVTTQAISTWCTPTGSNSLVTVFPGVNGHVISFLVEHCFDLALTSAAVFSSTRISASVLILKLQGLLCNVLPLLRSSGLCPRLIRKASCIEGFLLVRYTFIQIAKKKSPKNTFIQKHFHPKTLSSKNTFIQTRFHPRHFHPKTGSSNDTFIKRFRPMTLSSKNGFVQ